MAMLKIQPSSVSFQSSGADSVMPISLRQRQVEHAEGVGLADGQVHGEGGRRDQPAVEARPGDGVLAVEKGEQAHDASSRCYRSLPEGLGIRR